MEWKDTTSYQRDEPIPRVPRAWSAKAGVFRIVITKGHIYHPGEWVMHVFPGVLDTHDMRIPSTTSPEHAQKIAAEVFEEILLQALAVVRR